MRLLVHVRPGSSRTSVGGEHDGALLVRVQQRAVDGAATAAVITALADAFRVAPHCVQCVKGHTTRRKMIEISGDDVTLQERLVALRTESLLP